MSDSSKLVTRSELISRRSKLREDKCTIGFTSGVFDLVHAGHVQYLEEASQLCDELWVGVNSDSSVRNLKGALRPIIGESERVRVLAGLSSVAAVFLFNEANNNQNITLLEPDIYIKAGDYSRDKLSSAVLVEEYGGRVELVSLAQGLSTSSIIDTILTRHGMHGATCDTAPVYEKRPAVFLDRDGTLNKHIEYLHEPEKFELLPEVLPGLQMLQDAGYRLVVVTNQAGIGMGYFTVEDFYRVNKELLKSVSAANIRIDKIYFSPYSKSDNTPCRKPETGMIDRAVQELNIDLERSFVIGDTTTDMQLAANAGCKGILVETGFAGKDGVYGPEGFLRAPNVLEAAQLILETS